MLYIKASNNWVKVDVGVVLVVESIGVVCK